LDIQTTGFSKICLEHKESVLSNFYSFICFTLESVLLFQPFMMIQKILQSKLLVKKKWKIASPFAPSMDIVMPDLQMVGTIQTQHCKSILQPNRELDNNETNNQF
jgi:hypothetical protein